MPVVITGLRELRAELRKARLAAPRETTDALRIGAEKVTVRARQLTPVSHGGTDKHPGAMAASARPFANARSAGVRYSHPGAGVQEWATTYYRRRPGQSTGKVERALKAHVKRGQISAATAGLVEVHMVNVSGPPPRFAHKAVDELAPMLMEETWGRLLNIIRCHGWFV